MDEKQAPAAMDAGNDGGDVTSAPFPSEYEAFGYQQDGQYALLTDGYGYSHDLAMDSPLPESPMGLENFPPLGAENQEQFVQNNSEIVAETAMESHELDPHVITPGQQANGTPEGGNSTHNMDFIDFNDSQAPENLGDASSTQVLSSASSEHAATQPSQPAGLGHSHLGGPGQAGPQGVTGVDGTRQKTGGQTNMAASMANSDRVAPGSWQDVAERMVLITLPARGRPYKRPDLEDAVIKTGFPSTMVETFGEFERNFKYQMTVKTRKLAEDFCARNDKIVVHNDKGAIFCPVYMFKRREYRIRVSWYPDAGRDKDLEAALGTWGQVLGVHKDKVNGKLGKYNSGARIVTLVPNRDIEEVPDFLDINTMARFFTVRLTVKGLPNRCHRCRKRGHLQRDCTACQRCQSSDHATADHPPNQKPAFATLFRKVKPVVEYNEGEDDNEVQMEDAGAGVAAETSQPAAAAPPRENPENSVNQSSMKRASSSDKMASAANGAGLVDDENTQEKEWETIEGRKKHKVAKVATVVESIKQTLNTPVRPRSAVPVMSQTKPKAGTSTGTPRQPLSGAKPPATTPKVGGGRPTQGTLLCSSSPRGRGE